MLIARQSTAKIVTVGPVLDATGVAVTGGVVADFKISKNGGAPAALNASATLTHRHTGFYSLSLTTSDLDTVGTAEITIDDTVNACALKEISVVEEAVYDRDYAASAVGYVANAPVNMAQLGGDTQSATDLKDFADAGYDPATNKVQGVVLVDTLTTYTSNTPQTGDSFARLGAPVGASHAADRAAVKAETALIVADTNELQTDWVNGGRLDLILDARASQTSVDDLPTNAELATALAAADDAVLAQVALVKAQTDLLPSDPADQSLVIAATNAIIADTNDIQARLPAALTAGGLIKADVLAVDGETADADALGRVASNLDRAAKCVTHGTVDTGATTTSIPTSSLSPAAVVANQFQAEILGFPEDTTTAALRGQKTRIVGNTSGGVFEVEALTTAPVSGDVFVIE